jgi:hypothetical protein
MAFRALASFTSTRIRRLIRRGDISEIESSEEDDEEAEEEDDNEDEAYEGDDTKGNSQIGAMPF